MDNEGNKQTDIKWINVARSVAILLVVLCHSTENSYWLSTEFMSTVGTSSKICALFLFTLGRLGVPIFLFISGYLLLNRKYGEKEIKKFYSNNLLSLVVTTEIWIIIYDLYLLFFNQSDVSIVILLKNMLFLRSVDMGHMWYMPMIIGAYLFVPFVANALYGLKGKIMCLPMILMGIIYFLMPIVNLLRQINGDDGLNNIISFEFCGCYGFILLLGKFQRDGILKKIKSVYLIMTAAISFIATVGLQYYAYEKGVGYNVWYNCGTLIICSYAIFELISRIKTIKFEKVFFSISRCSFGIYLAHLIFIQVIARHFQTDLYLLKTIILFVASTLISWGMVHVVSKNKKLGKLLFFVKR